MNACNKEFIKKNGIDLSKIDTRIYTRKDINWIVDQYGISGKQYETEISMENLLGLDVNDDMKRYFPDILDSFFSEEDSYKSRSIGMLDYNENNILEGLRTSFNEKIEVINIDSGKSVIGDNGNHRFIILRLLYLHAKSKCHNEQQREQIKQRFKIPVIMSEYDLIKTYCKYLINIFQPANIINQHIIYAGKGRKLPFFKQRYNITTMVDIKKYKTKEISEEEYQDYIQSAISISSELSDDKTTIKFMDGREMRLTDEELIEFTRDIIKNSKHKKRILKDKSEHSFRNAMEKYESFRNFVAVNFGEEILTFESKIK